MRISDWSSDVCSSDLQLDGGAGAIAATLATGDRGAISEEDAEAMRRSGLAHLLSISGLHVSAFIGAVLLLVFRLTALSPRLALRWPLLLIAAAMAAAAGVGYTLLTGRSEEHTSELQSRMCISYAVL